MGNESRIEFMNFHQDVFISFFFSFWQTQIDIYLEASGNEIKSKAENEEEEVCCKLYL